MYGYADTSLQLLAAAGIGTMTLIAIMRTKNLEIRVFIDVDLEAPVVGAVGNQTHSVRSIHSSTIEEMCKENSRSCVLSVVVYYVNGFLSGRTFVLLTRNHFVFLVELSIHG